jgi:hypothetical protein
MAKKILTDVEIDGTLTVGGSSVTALVTSGSFTASSSVNVDNCFTSIHDDYFIVVNISAVSNDAVWLGGYLRASSANETGAVYKTSLLDHSGTSMLLTSNNASTEIYLMDAITTTYDTMVSRITFNSPALATATGFMTDTAREIAASSDMRVITIRGVVATTTIYDGFSLAISAGTMTGTYRVYGLPKARLEITSRPDSSDAVIASQVFS